MAHKSADLDATSQAHKKPPMTVTMVAPAATLVATWGVRKALGIGYKTATGHKPPTAQDRETSLVQVLAWTVVSAAAIAVVEVLVIRAVAHLAED